MGRRILGGALSLSLAMLAAGSVRGVELPTYANDVSGISWWLGDLPSYCAPVSPRREVCTWRAREAFNVACEVDRDTGQRVDDGACVVRGENDAPHVWPPEAPARKQHVRPESKRSLKERARAAFDGARTLREMIQLIGLGPRDCHFGQSLVCSWLVKPETPGYVTIARMADRSSERMRVLCMFPAQGGNRADESCRLTLGD